MADTNGTVALRTANDVRALMESMKQQFAMALPKHMTVERLMRVALTACQQNPKLLECTKRSFAAALMRSAQVGLEPDGTLGRAYLIPRKNNRAGTMEAHFQPGYLGLLDLCQRSGEIASVRADLVRKGDRLSYKKGLDEHLDHEEGIDNFDAEITHVYAIIRTKGGGNYWDIWPSAKVEAHRRRFSKDSREDSAWSTDWPSMAKKTLLTHVSKLAPKSIEVSLAVAADERAEAGLPMDVEIVEIPDAPAEAPKTIADLKKRAPKKEALPETAASVLAGEEPPIFDEGGKQADEKKGHAAVADAYANACAQQAQRIGPALFASLVKKHGGDPLEDHYALGSDGLKNLLDECAKT